MRSDSSIQMIHTSSGWLNTLSPFAIQFTETLGVRWYGLAYILGFFVTYLLARAVARRRMWPNPALLASDFVFIAACGTIVGGRLGYCLFYDPSLFYRFSGEFPFWGVFMIHRGGMASHGGMVGIIVACLWFAKRNGVDLWSLLDIVSLGGCVGIFFGRIANFINGELVGRPAPENLTWSVRFPQDIFSFPDQGLAKLQSLSHAVSKLGISAQEWTETISRESLSSIHKVMSSILERLHAGDPALAEAIAPALTPRHPSQLYEALLEGLLLGCVCFLVWLRSKKPGAVSVTFVLLYPFARVLGEQFRLPDAQIGFDWLGLTRGQWLSIVMFLLGIVMMRLRSQSLRKAAADS